VSRSTLQTLGARIGTRAIGATACGLAALSVEGLLAGGEPLLNLTWAQPSTESVCIIAQIAMAYLCLERHGTRRAPLAWWVGLVFAIALVFNVFYVLTFPGLVGQGGVIGTNASTSAYFFSSQYLVLGLGTTLAAIYARRRVAPMSARTQVALVVSAVATACAVALLLIWATETAHLPPLVGATGFTGAQTWLNRVAAAMLVTAGVLLHTLTSRYRPWLSRPLLYSIAILAATSLVSEFPIQRYDPAWYAVRVLRPLAYGLVLFAVLREYSGLYRDERRRADIQAGMATAAGELAALNSPRDIVRVLGQQLRFLVGGDRSVAVFLLETPHIATPAFAEGSVAALIMAGGDRSADAGLIGHVLRTRRPYTTVEETDPIGIPVPGAPDRPGAVLAVPLIGDHALGAAIMTRRTRLPYSELEIEAAMLFAQQASAALQRAYQAETVDRMKSEFVSLVSHELRTPLTSIKGYVELMLDGEVGVLTEEQNEFLRIVKQNADREVALINDLLDISRMEAGRLDLQREAIDVAELARAASESMRPQFEAKGQRLALELGPPSGAEEPPWTSTLRAWADTARVTQILMNLLSNAHKYTPAGGQITLTVRLTSSTGIASEQAEASGASLTPTAPTSERWSEWVLIEVADTGIGLSDEEQALVFGRFFRAKNRATEEVGGSGLGLAITRQLAEMHGGSVAVQSAPGVGSIFRVYLPAARTVADTGSGGRDAQRHRDRQKR
jgi:signal transduction histidine kinase